MKIKKANKNKITDKKAGPPPSEEKTTAFRTGKLKNKFFSKQQLSIKDYKHIYPDGPGYIRWFGSHVCISSRQQS